MHSVERIGPFLADLLEYYGSFLERLRGVYQPGRAAVKFPAHPYIHAVHFQNRATYERWPHPCTLNTYSRRTISRGSLPFLQEKERELAGAIEERASEYRVFGAHPLFCFTANPLAQLPQYDLFLQGIEFELPGARMVALFMGRHYGSADWPFLRIDPALSFHFTHAPLVLGRPSVLEHRLETEGGELSFGTDPESLGRGRFRSAETEIPFYVRPVSAGAYALDSPVVADPATLRSDGFHAFLRLLEANPPS